MDRDALLGERLARERGDLRVLDRQDAAAAPRRPSPRRRARGRSSRTRCRSRRSRRRAATSATLGGTIASLVGPDQLAVGLEPGQRARTRTGGEDDVLRLDVAERLAVLAPVTTMRPSPCEPRRAVDHIDLVLLHQVARRRSTAARPPCGSRSTTRGEVEARLVAREAELVGVRISRDRSRRCAAAPWSGCSPS